MHIVAGGIMACKTLLVLVIITINLAAAYGTTVCGDASGHWDVAGSPYIVTCDITVPHGSTLTIEPGVHVLFIGHFRLWVYGDLQAVGTPLDSIIFSSDYEKSGIRWAGIRFYGASSDCRLAYCVIEYGYANGGGSYEDIGGGIMSLQTSVQVSHSVIRHCEASYCGGGVALDTDTPVFEYCVITNNTSRGGGGVNCWHSAAIFRNCTISRNWGSSSGGAARVGGSTVRFVNTIFSHSIGSGVTFASGTPYGSFDYCDFFGNSTGNFSGDVPAGLGVITNTNPNGTPCDAFSNILVDPQFQDSLRDYHLRPGSPCIDAGNPDSPHDIDGSVVDMGAYTTMNCSGGGFVSLIERRPHAVGFRVTSTRGCVAQVIFAHVCAGSYGWATGEAAGSWTPSFRGDSLVFNSAIPIASGIIDTLWISAQDCHSQIEWCIGDTCGHWDAQLPVELLSFQATAGDGSVRLEWSTVAESTTDHFEIWRNGIDIAHLQALGNGSERRDYEYVDPGVINDHMYLYTLVAVDYDGNRSVLNTATVTPVSINGPITTYALYQNYPNPFNAQTTITFDLPQGGPVNLSVYNLEGRQVSVLMDQVTLSRGHQSLQFNASEFSSGVYIYRLSVNGFHAEKKFVLLK
jgi:hypothetical protein